MAHDKKLHFITGLLLSLLVGAVWHPVAGLIASVIAGAAKEIYDSTGRGTVDALDFVATAAGGLIGFVAIFMIVRTA